MVTKKIPFVLKQKGSSVFVKYEYDIFCPGMFTIDHKLKQKWNYWFLMGRSCVQDLQLTSFHFRYSKMTSSKNRFFKRRSKSKAPLQLHLGNFSSTRKYSATIQWCLLNFWSHNSRANRDGNHLVMLLDYQENFAHSSWGEREASSLKSGRLLNCHSSDTHTRRSKIH